MLISQSFVKDVRDTDCPRRLYYRYIERRETPPTDAMQAGRYFEWHLLGATRDGVEPVYNPTKTGGKTAIQAGLDDLIFKARSLMVQMGIRIKEGEAQLRLETDLFEGHLDLVTNDFADPTRKAIYDVKWTATALDDRWSGWADAENDADVKLQATHYTMLYKMARGEYVPFYYFVFGKSGWVRVIKCEITEEGMATHLAILQTAAAELERHAAAGWTAKPEFNRCFSCPFAAVCKDRARLPVVETFTF